MDLTDLLRHLSPIRKIVSFKAAGCGVWNNASLWSSSQLHKQSLLSSGSNLLSVSKEYSFHDILLFLQTLIMSYSGIWSLQVTESYLLCLR